MVKPSVTWRLRDDDPDARGEYVYEQMGAMGKERGERHSMRISEEQYQALSKPTYIVAELRCETFAESTQ